MTILHASSDVARVAADQLRALAQPQRLMILSCLLFGACPVGAIEAATGVGQPALSQQLAELRRAGLVQSRRASKQVFYALADDKAAYCAAILQAVSGSPAWGVPPVPRSGAPAATPTDPPLPSESAACAAACFAVITHA